MPDAAPTPAARPRQRSRARRAAAPALIVTLALLVILAIVHPFILRVVVQRKISAALGCRVSLRAATIAGPNMVILQQARLRVPQTPGPGGVFLEADSVDAYVDWPDLLAGRPGVTLLRLHKPLVRLSQGIDDGVLNIQRIPGGSMIGAKSLAPLPSVEFVDGVVEFGEHLAGSYTSLASMDVSGSVTVPDRSVAEYEINLIETGRGDQTPARLSGVFNLDRLAGSLVLTDLRLGLWRAWAAPSEARDLWRQMALDGLVKRTTFSVNEAGDIAAQFDLQDVDLTTPVPAPDPFQQNKLVRAQDVVGFVRFDPQGLTADLTGLIEDLPGRLTITTKGVEPDAAFEAVISTDNFVLSERPGLLPFAPPAAQTLFQRFSSPTGEVEGSVHLSRGPPTDEGPAPMKMRGEIAFRNARGAHEAFPYPFENMTGLVRFDEDEVEIVEVTGDGPSGARLRATGIIAPPVDEAAVNLTLRIENVPTDQFLADAMPPDRRAFLHELMSEPAMQRLLEAGLAISQQQRADLSHELIETRAALETLQNEPGAATRRAELNRRIESLRAALTTPVFDIGGIANVDVVVSRPLGLHAPYNSKVTIHFDQAGMLPAVFPYPFRARNMNIVFEESRAFATADSIEGLSGAAGSLEAEFRFIDQGETQETRPRIVIDVPRGPIDEYLIRAIPSAGFEGSGPSINETLRALRVTGEVSAHVEIGAKREGHTQFLAQVSLIDAHADPEAPAPMTERPERAPQTLPIADVRGDIVVSDRGLMLGPITGLLGAAKTPITLEGAWRRKTETTPAAFRASLEIQRLDLSEPIEALIATVAPDAAARTAERRASHRVEGFAHTVARAESVGAEPLRTSATLTNIRDLAFDASLARFSTPVLEGEARFTADGVRWSDVQGDFSIDGAPLGRVSIEGDAALDDQHATDLRLSSDAISISPAVIRAALAGRVPESIDAWLGRAQPLIAAHAEARLQSDAMGGLEWNAFIRPRRGEVISREGGVRIADMQGLVRIHRDGGRIEGLLGVGDGWSVSADGAWRVADDSTTLDIRIGLDAEQAPASLLALFPARVQDAAESLSLQIDGPWSIRDARLQWRDNALRFSANARFDDLSCDPGVALTAARGGAFIGVDRPRDSTQTSTSLDVTLDAFHLAGLSMTDGRVRLRSGAEPGRILVDQWQAECSGGRVTGRATLDTAPSGEDDKTTLWYEAETELAGVRLGALLADAARTRAAAEGSETTDDDLAERFAAYSGRIDARFAVAGRVGDSESRRGRGVVRVVGGSVVDAPLLVPIIELSNLRVPSGESLDRADADLYLVGKRATFETLRIESDSITMEGQGTVTWPDLTLDLEFRSRGAGRIPILSDILEGLRDEIATTTVTGTLREPVFGAEPLRGTRKMLDDVFGAGSDR